MLLGLSAVATGGDDGEGGRAADSPRPSQRVSADDYTGSRQVRKTRTQATKALQNSEGVCHINHCLHFEART